MATLARKLGVASRAAIIDRYVTLREAAFIEAPLARQSIFVGRAIERRAESSTLTAAERAVASLASRGLANRRIARERGCAVRTVANQLASIYRKLGITSRAELAVALSRR